MTDEAFVPGDLGRPCVPPQEGRCARLRDGTLTGPLTYDSTPNIYFPWRAVLNDSHGMIETWTKDGQAYLTELSDHDIVELLDEGEAAPPESIRPYVRPQVGRRAVLRDGTRTEPLELSSEPGLHFPWSAKLDDGAGFVETWTWDGRVSLVDDVSDHDIVELLPASPPHSAALEALLLSLGLSDAPGTLLAALRACPEGGRVRRAGWPLATPSYVPGTRTLLKPEDWLADDWLWEVAP